jgi:dipeptidyl-peptidase-4
MLIHGLADDNVVAAHSLRLSAALFEAGRRHELLLLPNVTHFSRSEAATENLLRLQLDFLRRVLRLDTA